MLGPWCAEARRWEVTATGARTYFGRTAELVRSADVESSEQQAVLGVFRALTTVNMAIVIGTVAYARVIGMTVLQIIPLVLAALLFAVPVAMPAVFTLAATLGARRLANEDVLLAKLSALQEAAMIDVLCVDKTGTLTVNSLGVSRVTPLTDASTEAAVLAYAGAASSADGQDPVDVAISSGGGAARRTGSAGGPLHALRSRRQDGRSDLGRRERDDGAHREGLADRDRRAGADDASGAGRAGAPRRRRLPCSSRRRRHPRDHGGDRPHRAQ